MTTETTTPRKLRVLPTTDAPCASCDARCCNTFPGVPSPEEFGAPNVDGMRAKLRALLDGGNWIVDHDSNGWLGGDPTAWFPRPRMTYESGHINDISFADRGTCVLLVANRCSDYEERPAGCRSLVASANKRCGGTTSKAKQVDAWGPYERMLLEEGYR